MSILQPENESRLSQTQSVDGLIFAALEKSKFRLQKTVVSGFQRISNAPLLASFQKMVQTRLAQFIPNSIAAKKEPDRVSWSDEKKRLSEFYGFLNGGAVGLDACNLCEAVVADTENELNEALREDNDPGVQMSWIVHAREKIGKIVYLADRHPNDFNNISKDSIDASLQDVEQLVDAKMRALKKELKEKNAVANRFDAQEKDTVLYSEKGKLIADLLLTSHGQLNLGLINLIEVHFVPNVSKRLEYEEGIQYVLDQIDLPWQKVLSGVRVPTHPDAIAIVRADLGLSTTETITKRHCQQVILDALLSQLNQGPVGDCFAVAWAIKKHNEYMLDALKDYADLLHHGHLTRSVGGSPEHFFFERSIAGGGLNKQFTLRDDGTIDEYNEAYFWECPNFLAACKMMGISVSEDEISEALPKVLGTDTAAKSVTWDEVITGFAKSKEQAALGRYGFSLSDNRMLRAWETALAGMAEARPGDYIRDNINNCVMSLLKGVFESSKTHLQPYQASLVDELKRIFQMTLNNSSRLVYNGAIPLKGVSSDGSSSSGGFELYQKDLSDLTKKGTRIATPGQFKTFIIDVVDRAAKREFAKFTSQEDISTIQNTTNSLHMYILNPQFMRDVLWTYEEKNKGERDPVKNYAKLERTPMTSLDGDNPWEVMAIDTGKDFTPDIRTIRPKNPADLLYWLLGLARWKEDTQKYLSDNNPNEGGIATSPQHAFNISFENAEFKEFIGTGKLPDIWAQERIIASGLNVSKTRMDHDAKKVVSQRIKEWISRQNTIPEHLEQEVEALFKSLNSKIMNVHQYGGRLRDGLVGIFKLDNEKKHNLSLALDGFLVQSLPESARKEIATHAFRFAKTNWDSGSKNVYFCCFFNPRTEKIDFGSIDEDFTNLQFMNQYEWIVNKDWEVNPHQI